MPFGYNGKILHINLSENSWEVEEPDEAWYRTYVLVLATSVQKYVIAYCAH